MLIYKVPRPAKHAIHSQIRSRDGVQQNKNYPSVETPLPTVLLLLLHYKSNETAETCSKQRFLLRLPCTQFLRKLYLCAQLFSVDKFQHTVLQVYNLCKQWSRMLHTSGKRHSHELVNTRYSSLSTLQYHTLFLTMTFASLVRITWLYSH